MGVGARGIQGGAGDRSQASGGDRVIRRALDTGRPVPKKLFLFPGDEYGILPDGIQPGVPFIAPVGIRLQHPQMGGVRQGDHPVRIVPVAVQRIVVHKTRGGGDDAANPAGAQDTVNLQKGEPRKLRVLEHLPRDDIVEAPRRQFAPGVGTPEDHVDVLPGVHVAARVFDVHSGEKAAVGAPGLPVHLPASHVQEPGAPTDIFFDEYTHVFPGAFVHNAPSRKPRAGAGAYNFSTGRRDARRFRNHTFFPHSSQSGGTEEAILTNDLTQTIIKSA